MDGIQVLVCEYLGNAWGKWGIDNAPKRTNIAHK